MAPKDVYNMDENGLFYRARPNKTLSTRKILWVPNSEGPSRSCSCCKHDMHWQVETCDYLQISTSKMLWRWLPTNYVWRFANQTAWVTSYVFYNWMMSLNVHFKSQKWNVLLNMDNSTTHSLSILVGVNHLVFRPCNWPIFIYLSYHLILQVWYNPWIRE